MSVATFCSTFSTYSSLELAHHSLVQASPRSIAGPYLGHMFLILVDAHSKWLEVRLLSSILSSAIVLSLCSIFAEFGLPSILVMDNGSYFTSSEFQHFTHQNGIKHFFSSPYHPLSNGLAERGIQIFKKEMSKIKEARFLS